MAHFRTSAATAASPSSVPVKQRGNSAAHEKKCRILLILRPNRANLAADFQRIGQYVSELDDRVQLRVVTDLPHTVLRPCVWSRPTLSVALRRVLLFHPLRGPLYQCWPYTKIQEYRRLDAAGIPVAPWAILRPGHTPDLSSFGPVVVVKPAAGGRGTGVRLVRPGEVRYERPVNRGTWRCRDLVVQRFIYTGPWASYYRVTTFFGQVLSCDRVDMDHAHAPLPHPNELSGGGVCFDPAALYPRRDTRRIQLINDTEVIALGERAHQAAFSDVPLLGVDVIREHETGRLFVTEVNAGGSTWHFSTRTGLIMQQSNGFNFESQFDGFRKAARILVEQARLHAW